MDAIVVIMMMCVGFFGVVAIFCVIIDYLVDIEKGRRELDKKCADRRKAVNELLEIRREHLKD